MNPEPPKTVTRPLSVVAMGIPGSDLARVRWRRFDGPVLAGRPVCVQPAAGSPASQRDDGQYGKAGEDGREIQPVGSALRSW